MNARRLFSSPLLEIREVTCDAVRGGAGGEEQSAEPALAIPLRGCYRIETGRAEVVADPNTAAFFDAGPAYRVAHPIEGGDVSFVFAYAPGPVADAFGNATRPDCVRRPFRASHAALGARLQLRVRLLRSSLGRAAPDAFEIEERAFAILGEVAGYDVAPASRHDIVSTAKVLLNDRFREPVSLADVARGSRSTPFALSRRFAAATGTTLHRYLVALRLAAALDAIAAGENNLTRVALDAGFAHHSHLTRHFGRSFGSPPRALRDQLRAATGRPDPSASSKAPRRRR